MWLKKFGYGYQVHSWGGEASPLCPSNAHMPALIDFSDLTCMFPVLLLDVDECLGPTVHCGPNRMCFNVRGSYQCVDTPCPPNYQRDPVSGYVLPSLPRHAFEKPVFLSLLDQQALSVVTFNSQEVSSPRGLQGYSMFLPQ